MMGFDSSWLLAISAFLLNYLTFSTIVLGLAFAICPSNCVKAAVSRVRLWKLAMLIPLPLAATGMCVPAAWLPTVPLEQMLAPAGGAASSKSGDKNSRLHLAPSDEPIGRPQASQSHEVDAAQTRVQSPGLIYAESAWSRESAAWLRYLAASILSIWACGTLVGMLLLLRDLMKLHRLIGSSSFVTEGPLVDSALGVGKRMHLKRPVPLLTSSRVSGPFAVGWRTPRILLPVGWMEQLSEECREAVLAHELSHVSRRDAKWNLIAQMLCRVLWIQPLNALACHRLRRDMEFVADEQAARVIGSPAALARSLVRLAERMTNSTCEGKSFAAIASGMSIHLSGLRCRVSTVLSMQDQPAKPVSGVMVAWLVTLVYIALLLLVPRFGITTTSNPAGETSDMLSSLKKMSLTSGLLATVFTAPIDGVLGQESGKQASGTTATETEGGLPEGLAKFSGMLIGKMVKRDIERGSFTVEVQYVARVWENNKARNPRSVVGKQVTVNGVSGKWIDELLLVRSGETVEFEAQHRGGDELTFPGEWLKKVPAFDPDEHPVPPEGFRGFSGMVTGKIIKKNPTSRELHVRIDAIEKSFQKSRAKSAADAVGKDIVLAGFWARMSKPFDKLEEGDHLRAGVLHRVPESDHFTVIETAEKVQKGKPPTNSASKKSTSAKGFPEGMKGFRGILRGKLLKKDVEQGTLVFQADKVTRTWKKNAASDTGSCQGCQFLVQGISGKWVDVLISLKVGDSIEVEAFHNSGEHLDFVSEWLKKVE